MRHARHMVCGIVCAASLVAGACGKSDRTSGERAATRDSTGGTTTTVAMRSFDGDTAVAREGRQLFLTFNCYGCHGGLAGGAMGPSLRDTVWKFGGTDSAIFNSIHDGRPAGMPTWAGTLSPEQIKVLVVYIRSLRTPAEPTFFWPT